MGYICINGTKPSKTRLISIVSNPIKIVIAVVVIAVVVFAKKNMVQKVFDPKAIHVKKSDGPKNIWVK